MVQLLFLKSSFLQRIERGIQYIHPQSENVQITVFENGIVPELEVVVDEEGAQWGPDHEPAHAGPDHHVDGDRPGHRQYLLLPTPQFRGLDR